MTEQDGLFPEPAPVPRPINQSLWRGMRFSPASDPGLQEIGTALLGRPTERDLFGSPGMPHPMFNSQPRMPTAEEAAKILEWLDRPGEHKWHHSLPGQKGETEDNKNRPRGRGLGPHWTTDRNVADDAATLYPNTFGVVVEGDWPKGQGLDPYTQHLQDEYPNEAEVRLNPGAPVDVRRMHFYHPKLDQWGTVDLPEPSERTARLLFGMGAAEDGAPPNLLDLVEGLAGQGNGRWVYPHASTDDRGYTEWSMNPSDAPASFTDPGKYDTPRTVFYDPARASVKPGEFRPEVVYTNPNAIRRLEDDKMPPGYLWRGMSDEEFQAAKQRGYFESNGAYNIGGDGNNEPGSPGFQNGRTFFSTQPSSADNYASGFAPWQYTPTFSRPAHVIGIPDQPDAPRGPSGDDPKSHEVGLAGRIPFDSVAHHWVGHVSDMNPGRWVGYVDSNYSDPPYRGGSARASLEWEPEELTPDVSKIARLLFADDSLLLDPRHVDPAYFTGIHEMAHALDQAGGALSQELIGPLLTRAYQEETGRPVTGQNDSVFWQWVNNQFPKQGTTSAPEMLAHAFTEVRLNPQGAKPVHKVLHNLMVQLSQTNQPKSFATLIDQGVPKPLQTAVEDIQKDYPQVDVNRVGITPDGKYGPAYLELDRGEPAQLMMDDHYARPFSGMDPNSGEQKYDPKPFQDWFDDKIDNQEYPRWQSTMAGEPWPEDAIEDMATEFDQPAKVGSLRVASFPQFGIRHALITDDAIYGLSREFTEWAKNDSMAKIGNPRDMGEAKKFQRGPIGHWPFVERFLKQKYPAAYRGLEYGLEQAEPLIDMGEGDARLRGKLGDPYETGPEAYAKHGYDPKETAAAMLLLHNDSHPGRQNYRERDTKRLFDIMQKRMKMQRDYEKRQKGTPPLEPEMAKAAAAKIWPKLGYDVDHPWNILDLGGNGYPTGSDEAYVHRPKLVTLPGSGWAEGDPTEERPVGEQKWREVKYHPDKGFYHPDTGESAGQSEWAHFAPDRRMFVASLLFGMAYGDPPPDMTGFTFHHDGYRKPTSFSQFTRVKDPTQAWLKDSTGKLIGNIEWGQGNEVLGIHIDPEHRRKGYATALFDWAKKNARPRLEHSDALTSDGAAWTKEMYDWDPQAGGDDSIYGIQESERVAAIFPPYDEGRERLADDDPYRAPAPAPDATWYHVSPTRLNPGDRLRPFGGERPYGQMYDHNPMFKHRDQHVWVEHDPYTTESKWANDAKPFIYEVTPEESPQPYNGTGSEGWVTPGATVKRLITDNGWLPSTFADAGRTASVFADPDGRGVWCMKNGSLEFVVAPHALSGAGHRR